MRMRSYKTKKGMTLIEVLISLAILSIILIPIGNLINNSVIINHKGNEKQNAMTVSQQIIEEIKASKEIGTGSDGTIINLSNGISIRKQVDASNNITYDTIQNQVNNTKFFAKVQLNRASQYESNNSISSVTPEVLIQVFPYYYTIKNVKDNMTETRKDFAGLTSGYPLIIDYSINSDVPTYSISFASCSNAPILVSSTNFTANTIKILFNSDIKFTDSYQLNVTNSTADSSSSRILNVYTEKEKTANVDCQVNNGLGQVKVYNNLYSPDASANPSPGQYNLKVSIYKSDADYNSNSNAIYTTSSSVNIEN